MLLWFTLQYHQFSNSLARSKSSVRVQIKTNEEITYQCLSVATISKFPSKDCSSTTTADSFEWISSLMMLCVLLIAHESD